MNELIKDILHQLLEAEPERKAMQSIIFYYGQQSKDLGHVYLMIGMFVHTTAFLMNIKKLKNMQGGDK
jgi:hypothetical protein